jgi:FAD/FMN-containing dehydrogenase
MGGTCSIRRTRTVPSLLSSNSYVGRNTHDAYHVIDQEEMVCSAITYPSSVSEVQAIVRWANEFKIPIYPISMGRNLGYGGSAPRVPGSVVIDLGRNMNKVLKFDGDNASCMVEPGVSYFKLYEEIQTTGKNAEMTRVRDS